MGVDTLWLASSFGSDRYCCCKVIVGDGGVIGDLPIIDSVPDCNSTCCLGSSEGGDLARDICVCSIDSESLLGWCCLFALGGGGGPGDNNLVAMNPEVRELIGFVNVKLVS